MKNTSWDVVANWYSTYLQDTDTYQAKVIAPNLVRFLGSVRNKQVLDLACGEGYFARLVAKEGAIITGVDLSSLLITRAKASSGDISFVVAPAHKTTLKKDAFDIVFTVLAFENIKNISEVVTEIKRILKKDGRFVLVLLHPAFRVPKHSDWGFDQGKAVQYRRVEKYLSEVQIEIEQNPSKGEKSKKTITFHRPLQWYMKAFKKEGFAITALEEWISHKKSTPGKRQKAEDAARKEFPMFLALEFKKE